VPIFVLILAWGAIHEGGWLSGPVVTLYLRAANELMQRFLTTSAKYSYSRAHDPIGWVQPGEQFSVECIEGWSGYFRKPSDLTPEAYASAEARKWAVTGPICVESAEPGAAVAIKIHDIEIVTPGVVLYGGYDSDEPLEWWDDETACAIYPVNGGAVHFDDRTSLPAAPLIGCLAVAPEEGTVHAKLQGTYGGNLDSRAIRPGATVTLPVASRGGGLYFGDCKALMGDGEIAAPPEVGAVVSASAEPRDRPKSMFWPRVETDDSLMTIVSGTPLEWAARQAFRELLNWVTEEYDLSRPKAGLLLAMVAHAGICQVSNDAYTASCGMPRAVLAPYEFA
jgi:amidase